MKNLTYSKDYVTFIRKKIMDTQTKRAFAQISLSDNIITSEETGSPVITLITFHRFTFDGNSEALSEISFSNQDCKEH